MLIGTHNPLLAPLSWCYALVVGIRHLLYDEHILRSHTVDIPTICVGNIAVGGTGKTPVVEYLLSELRTQYRIAVLSRGYGRKTHGFRLVSDEDSALTVGDEPMQMHRHFPNIPIAVCADRVEGIQRIKQHLPDVECVILDDALQHRRIQCGYTILLTAQDNLYPDDAMLPYGTLRDIPRRAYRADAIIVTKCSTNMKPIEMRIINNKLRPYSSQQLAFTSLTYDDIPHHDNPLVITGIANPQPMMDYVHQTCPDAQWIAFPDHHDFTNVDIEQLRKKAAACDGVLTTEKDYERLLLTPLVAEWGEKLKTLPIHVKPLDGMDNVIRHIQMYLYENTHHQPHK